MWVFWVLQDNVALGPVAQTFWQWLGDYGLALTASGMGLMALWIGGRAVARWIAGTVWPDCQRFLDGLRRDHKEGMEGINGNLAGLRELATRTDLRLASIEEEQQEMRQHVAALKGEMHARFDRAGYGRAGDRPDESATPVPADRKVA